MPIPEPVWYQNIGNQSGTGMLRYRTEIQDAGSIDLVADAQLWTKGTPRFNNDSLGE